MLVRLYSLATLPQKYKSEILENYEDLCVRINDRTRFLEGRPTGVTKPWLNLQLNAMYGQRGADYVIVCLQQKKIVGFIVAYARDKGPKPRKKNHWHLDIICRKHGSEYMNVSRLLVNRLIAEALKNSVQEIGLYATTQMSVNAYKRLGFVTSEDFGENGADMIMFIS